MFLRVVDILIFDLGVADIYFLTTVCGFGIPPPIMLTEVVLTLGLVLFATALMVGGLLVEPLLDWIKELLPTDSYTVLFIGVCAPVPMLLLVLDMILAPFLWILSI